MDEEEDPRFEDEPENDKKRERSDEEAPRFEDKPVEEAARFEDEKKRAHVEEAARFEDDNALVQSGTAALNTIAGGNDLQLEIAQAQARLEALLKKEEAAEKAKAAAEAEERLRGDCAAVAALWMVHNWHLRETLGDQKFLSAAALHAHKCLVPRESERTEERTRAIFGVICEKEREKKEAALLKSATTSVTRHMKKSPTTTEADAIVAVLKKRSAEDIPEDKRLPRTKEFAQKVLAHRQAAAEKKKSPAKKALALKKTAGKKAAGKKKARPPQKKAAAEPPLGNP